MYFKILRSVIFENYRFYLGYFLFFLGGIIAQLFSKQDEISLYINSYHHPVPDFIFSHITVLGDGIFAAVVIVVIFLFRRSYWISALVSMSVPGIVTQLLKRFVYADSFRPAIVLKDHKHLHYVEGVYINELNSFPSGHSTTAFAVFTFIALMNMPKNFQFLLLLLAILVGFSRIYLLQHFLEDVVLGSFIGVSFSTVLFAAFEYRRLAKATLPSSDINTTPDT